MKKLSLSDFEYHISSTTRAAGTTLLAEGKVSGLKELEKHFWVSRVQDTEMAYETEVIISPGKIQAFACECWGEPRKFMCAHIAASLLHLRRFLYQSAEEKARKAREKAETQPELTRLTIQRILPGIPAAQLQDFIRDYARRDRDFALALKTRFADAVDGTGNPYKILLASVLPKHQKPWKEADFKRVTRLLNDFDSRLATARTEGNLSAAHRIAAAVLEGLAPVITQQSESVKARLGDLCREYAVVNFEVYDTDGASPELKDAVWSSLLGMVAKEQLPDLLHRDFTEFLGQVAAREKTRMEQLKKAFLAADTTVSRHLSQLYMVALAQAGQTTQVLKVFTLVYLQSESGELWSTAARHALLELYYTQSLEAAALIIDTVLERHALPIIRRTELEKLRFHIAETTGDTERQLRYLQKILAQYGRYETFEHIRQLSGSAWPTAFQELLTYMKQEGTPARIAQLLAWDGQKEVLALWLKEQQDLELCIDFADALSDGDLTALMQPLLAQHLEEHFGRPGSEYVRDNLGKILRQKRFLPVKQLIAQLSKQFPERVGLPETMNEIYDRLKIQV